MAGLWQRVRDFGKQVAPRRRRSSGDRADRAARRAAARARYREHATFKEGSGGPGVGGGG